MMMISVKKMNAQRETDQLEYLWIKNQNICHSQQSIVVNKDLITLRVLSQFTIALCASGNSGAKIEELPGLFQTYFTSSKRFKSKEFKTLLQLHLENVKTKVRR